MAKNKFIPDGTLEEQLLAARKGDINSEAFLDTLIKSSIYVLSGSEINDDMSNFSPVVFDRNGVIMYAVFTSMSRTGDFAQQAPFCIQVNAFEFFKRVPAGGGIVVNPGIVEGLEISPEGLTDIVSKYSKTS